MNSVAVALQNRLDRIKIVSRIFRWIVLGFFAFSIWMAFWLPPLTHGAFLRGIVHFIYGLILCVWYWKLAQLFHFYERGRIFAAETIRCIKQLGWLCVSGGILMSLYRVLSKTVEVSNPHPPQPPGVSVVTHVSIYKIGFFSFDFGTGVDFGWLLTGITIVLVAWIMDEGRKIQEEQALTI